MSFFVFGLVCKGFGFKVWAPGEVPSTMSPFSVWTIEERMYMIVLKSNLLRAGFKGMCHQTQARQCLLKKPGGSDGGSCF